LFLDASLSQGLTGDFSTRDSLTPATACLTAHSSGLVTVCQVALGHALNDTIALGKGREARGALADMEGRALGVPPIGCIALYTHNWNVTPAMMTHMLTVTADTSS